MNNYGHFRYKDGYRTRICPSCRCNKKYDHPSHDLNCKKKEKKKEKDCGCNGRRASRSYDR